MKIGIATAAAFAFVASSTAAFAAPSAAPLSLSPDVRAGAGLKDSDHAVGSEAIVALIFVAGIAAIPIIDAVSGDNGHRRSVSS